MESAISILTMRSSASPHPRRNSTTWHGCTRGNTSTSLTVSAAKVEATWTLIPTHRRTPSVRLAEQSVPESRPSWPLFPGTGKAEEVGGPNAVGLTVNIPIPRGATGDIVRCALEEIAHPAIDRFVPDWVLVSCGFDAHRADPLGELALSTGDFAQLAQLVRSFASRTGRLALFLEGGYNAETLRTSVAAVLGTLLDLSIGVEAPTFGGPGREAIAVAEIDRDKAMAALQ
jgi:hypothetical protein